MQVGAWKAVHVLAGSIIEAVLVDYLFAIGYHKEDPLRVSLERAITICKQKGILSEKTEHIAHAGTTALRYCWRIQNEACQSSIRWRFGSLASKLTTICSPI